MPKCADFLHRMYYVGRPLDQKWTKSLYYDSYIHSKTRQTVSEGVTSLFCIDPSSMSCFVIFWPNPLLPRPVKYFLNNALEGLNQSFDHILLCESKDLKVRLSIGFDQEKDITNKAFEKIFVTRRLVCN